MQRPIRFARDLFGNGLVAAPDLLPDLPAVCQFARPHYRSDTRAPPAMNLPPRPLLVLLAAGLLAGCNQVPVTGRRAMSLVDDKEVTKMSVAMFDDMKRRQRPSRDKDRIAQLQRVGERIAKVVFWDMPDADWEFVVFDNPQINAFAMAGGKVGVYSGLFKVAKTDDQVAAVIAHEIAHVTAKHVHEKLSQQLAVDTVGTVGMIGLGASGAPAISTVMLGNAYGLGTGIGALAFDRKKELEADYIGLMYMARAGYDPQAAVQVMEALETETAGAPAQAAWFSTHPSHPERVLRLLDAMPKAQQERAQSAAARGPNIVK